MSGGATSGATVTALGLLGLILFWLVVMCWLLSPPPLPPLADDAQRFDDCTLSRSGPGCGVWPN